MPCCEVSTLFADTLTETPKTQTTDTLNPKSNPKLYTLSTYSPFITCFWFYAIESHAFCWQNVLTVPNYANPVPENPKPKKFSSGQWDLGFRTFLFSSGAFAFLKEGGVLAIFGKGSVGFLVWHSEMGTPNPKP